MSNQNHERTYPKDLGIMSEGYDRSLLPRFNVVAKSTLHIPDQSKKGDAGYDIRVSLRDQDEVVESNIEFESWLKHQVSRFEKLRAESMHDTPLEPVRIPVFDFFINGKKVLDKNDESIFHLKKTWFNQNRVGKETWWEASWPMDFASARDWFARALSNFCGIQTKCHVLLPGDFFTFQTGFKIALPDLSEYRNLGLPVAMEFNVHARSGFACKHGLRVRNQVGVVDTGYRDEVMISIENSGPDVQVITEGTRIGQGVMRLCLDLGNMGGEGNPNMDYREELLATNEHFSQLASLNNRGGGLGSTGHK